MANRYCNLVGSKKISEDFQNINIGFDAVQQDMDSKSSGDHRHPNATDTTDGFMSAQDKAKMDASTASATPGTLVQRDASGRMKAAAPSAKTDVARKAEVDAVQADLDEHKADAVMHVTEADHEKLDSIEEGAEVNQNAFARVNDIEASEKTDALTFKGGVGIKVTTNPTTKEVTFTATGDSTPGAHGSSHTEHGSDPIPNATAKEGGLMSAADKADHDKIAPEVPKHSEQLKEHTAELEDHEQRIEDVETGLADVPGTPLELQPGLRVVETEQDTPFRMGEVKGRTLINLPGSEGNFDYRTSPLFTFFGTGEIIPASTPVGTKVQKIVCNRAADSPGHFGARYELNIDRSKHYVALAYLDNISCDEPVYFSFAEWKSTGYSTIRKSGNVKKGDGIQYRYIDISPDRLETQEKLVFYFRGEGTAGAEFRIGAFGLYEITQAEYEAIGKMKFAQVAERYPYVDSMTNVKNPYAIVTGGNLLPPFYEWATHTVNYSMDSPYEISINKIGSGTIVIESPRIPASAGRTYTISANVQPIVVEGSVYVNVIGLDEKGDIVLDTPGAANDHHHSFVVPEGVTELTARAIIQGVAPDGRYNFSIPILTIGTEPKPFVPQQRSILAFETELAAHPVDGSNPDTLFMGDDGLPYVLEPWKKVTLDGSYTWAFNITAPGLKRVVSALAAQGATHHWDAFLVKPNGQLLQVGSHQDGADKFSIEGAGDLFITISNTDSGWGPDYEPSQDEIKAYFLGWKMYDGLAHGDGTGTYNRTDGLHKAWTPLDSFNGTVYVGVYSGSGTPKELPSTANATYYVKHRYWQPYSLQYLKVKPTIEPVHNYELGATLSSGSNMVEVGSGIVIREKANPYGNYINAINAPGGRLNYRTTRLLEVYQNQTRDFGWTFKDGVWNGEPYQYAENPIPEVDAVYHVTYTMLDPTLAAPISGTVAANLRGTVTDLVQDVGDVQRRLSVVETQKADAVEDTGWIPVTPLNGWVQYSANPCRFRLRGKTLKFVGLLSQGTTAAGTTLFQIPVSLSGPNVVYRLQVPSWSSGESKSVLLTIDSAGKMMISNAPSSYFIGFDGFELEADWVVKKS
ncbi:hypothetical protein ABEV00_27495 [Paenibacillus thiaminolyticus]|uniref:hypothetical protein n=1 Tax=Paenibacillus thiaminolyticus TaxID=49283 RepID=UPI003D291A2D